MRLIGVPALAGVMLLIGMFAADAKYKGQAHAKDGDSWFFVVPHPKRLGATRHREIRPSGIDSPELSQPCTKDGRIWFAAWDAGKWLTEILHGKTVECVTTGKWTFGREVGNCTIHGVDLQAVIVRAGWAFDYPRYSGGKYAALEAEARAAGRGIHQGVCEAPWIWRRKNY